MAGGATLWGGRMPARRGHAPLHNDPRTATACGGSFGEWLLPWQSLGEGLLAAPVALKNAAAFFGYRPQRRDGSGGGPEGAGTARWQG